MSNYSRMLIERLSKPDPNTSLRPDQLRYASLPGAESITGCEVMAHALFMIIREHHGDEIARDIFAKWGTLPSDNRLTLIANIGLLDRLDMMKPKPNMQRLAREIAEENKALPRAEQRGAGGIDPKALTKQIRRIRDLRTTHMEKGTWLGPFPDGA